MDEVTYIYGINSIYLKNGEPFTPGRINVFVGANNCGKTQLLKDMLGYIMGTRTPPIILNELEVPYPQTWDAIEQAYNMKIFENNQSKDLVDENGYDEVFSDFFNNLIFGQCYSVNDVVDGIPNRNGVAHSWYIKYPSQKAALNAILLTDFVLSLKPKNEAEDIEKE